ncbi:MAG: pallilysin-related adhesin [Spirochaetales bacterium]|nr:pallilysin-related adhesin [Spirochaetales bacterium]
MKIKVILIIITGLLFSCTDRNNNPDYFERTDDPDILMDTDSNYFTADSPYSDSRGDISPEQELKVPLAKNEYLLQVINSNLDLDVTDEQILVIKIVDDSELPIKIAVIDYDEIMSAYGRSWESFTNGTNHRVFEIEFMDIVGDYNKEIIFYGMKNKDVTLDVFRRTPSLSNPGLMFMPICQLISDGTISIIRKKRSATYELGQKTGESFPIIVERRDKDSDNENDMIRETYRWVYSSNKYEFIPPVEKIPGKIIEDKKFNELIASKGTDDFEKYLEGPWYDSKDLNKMILFFPDEKEVVFYTDNAQEVYSWDYSSRRSNPLQLIIMIRNILVRSIKKTLNVTAGSLHSLEISTNDETWAGDYLKVKEELQESLYNRERDAVTPSAISLSGIFEEEFKLEGKSMQIIFEPPFFTRTREVDGDILDHSGGFTIIKNIPVINDYYYKKYLQYLPDTIESSQFKNDILKNIRSSHDRSIIQQYYNYNSESKKYQLKPFINSEEKTMLWRIFVSIQYRDFLEYDIGVISFKILKEDGLVQDIENYILEYAKEIGPDKKGYKKTIILTPGHLYVNGIEAITKDSIRLVQYLEN